MSTNRAPFEVWVRRDGAEAVKRQKGRLRTEDTCMAVHVRLLCGTCHRLGTFVGIITDAALQPSLW